MTTAELPKLPHVGDTADQRLPTALGRPPGEDGDGSPRTGTLSLRTTHSPMAFLLLLTRTRVELDDESWELPWGHLRLPVPAGGHRLQVSFRYLGKDRGAATEEIYVEAGHAVEVRYRAPWLIFRPGALRVVAERERMDDEASSHLTALEPSTAASAGWYRDPTDQHQRRWWDGERWTGQSLRPRSTRYKVGVALLGLIGMVLGVVAGSALGGELGDGAGSLTESTPWVTLSDIEGVRIDMPGEPQVTTEQVPGTDIAIDLYVLEFDDIGMVTTAVSGEVAGDDRTDAQVLGDSAAGAAEGAGATIVDSAEVVVDGHPGLDTRATSTRDGGVIILGRFVLAGDLLVVVQTVVPEDDPDAGTTAHDRTAGSMRFTD